MNSQTFFGGKKSCARARTSYKCIQSSFTLLA